MMFLLGEAEGGCWHPPSPSIFRQTCFKARPSLRNRLGLKELMETHRPGFSAIA